MILPPDQTSNLAIREYQNKTILTFNTPWNADEGAEALKLVRSSRCENWIWQEGKLTKWDTFGLLPKEKNITIWGDFPFSENLGFKSISLFDNQNEENINLLARFIQDLIKSDLLPEKLNSYSIFTFTLQGKIGFLLLNSKLSQALSTLEPLEKKLSWEPFFHPQAQGADAWAFFLSSLILCRILTRLPWAGQEDSLIREEIRQLKPKEIKKWLKNKDSKLSTLMIQSLMGHGGLSLNIFTQNIGKLQENSFFESPKELNLILAQEDTKRTQAREQTLFWRRRGGLIFTIGIVSLIVLFFAGWYLWELLKPIPSDSWPETQVVKEYYNCFNSLNDNLAGKLTDNIKGSQPKTDVDLLSQIFIIRQVQMGYTQKNMQLTPDDWITQGKGALVPPKFIYGIKNVQFQNLGNGNWYIVYDFWTSFPGSNQEEVKDNRKNLKIAHNQDHLKIIKTSRGWKIHQIQRLSTPIDVSPFIN